jgi:hypothetical protein
MTASDSGDDGEAKTVTLAGARSLIVKPLEGLEESVDFIWRLCRSGVGNRDHRPSGAERTAKSLTAFAFNQVS